VDIGWYALVASAKVRFINALNNNNTVDFGQVIFLSYLLCLVLLTRIAVTVVYIVYHLRSKRSYMLTKSAVVVWTTFAEAINYADITAKVCRNTAQFSGRMKVFDVSWLLHDAHLKHSLFLVASTLFVGWREDCPACRNLLHEFQRFAVQSYSTKLSQWKKTESDTTNREMQTFVSMMLVGFGEVMKFIKETSDVLLTLAELIAWGRWCIISVHKGDDVLSWWMREMAYQYHRVGLKTTDHRRTHHRPPPDERQTTTGQHKTHRRTHCRMRKIILFHFRRGSMLK